MAMRAHKARGNPRQFMAVLGGVAAALVVAGLGHLFKTLSH